MALVDPVQAHQVLLNLCINARDAMGEIGRIVVNAQSVQRAGNDLCQLPPPLLRNVHRNSRWRIPGAASRRTCCDRMFDPFFSTKDIGHGTGMGLSIVHGVVHEHGGHVLVESQRGRGTTFRVLLPIATRGTTPKWRTRRRQQHAGTTRCADAC